MRTYWPKGGLLPGFFANWFAPCTGVQLRDSREVRAPGPERWASYMPKLRPGDTTELSVFDSRP
jgi:hypothetical protein